MAGLLDAIFPSSDGGGLLDFLKRNAQNQAMPSGLPSDTAQYGSPQPQAPMPVYGKNDPIPADTAQWPVGPVGSPYRANAAPLPQNPPPVIPASMPQQQTPTAAPAPQSPGFLSGYQNFHDSFRNGGGLIGSLASAFTGQRNDPAAVAQRQQAQTAQANFQALVEKGVPRNVAFAAVQPGNEAVLKNVWDQANAGAHRTETDKDGNVWDIGQNGERKLLLQPRDDKFQNVEVKDSMGNVIGHQPFNQKTGEYGALQTNGPAGNGGSDLPGDVSKTGADYIASLPSDKMKETVAGMIDGTIQPPSSFAASKPYWQTLIAAAKHADKTWDENNWAARHKMSVDLASSGNSSMGGILSNGESAFKHLAGYTGSVADQGNVSHNFPGGGMIAHAQNTIGNALGGSDTEAKVKAVNDNLGHYGQESTKFYAGTGGGVEERMNALHEMNANATSGEEAAAYAEKEKGLMLDRLNSKLREIKDTYGEEKGNRIIAKHMPDIQQSLRKINANIDRLRGIKPGAPGSASFGSTADVAEPAQAGTTAASTIAEGATATNPQTGQKIIFKGGKWGPVQ